ncbi:MAG TPA: dienelactone hydrolase family protein [Drouetiella sp.]
MENTMTLREHQFNLELGTFSLPVFCAEPDNEKRLPGLLLIHEIFGVNDHIRDLARRFAQHGIRVYAPDLLARAESFPKTEKERENLDVMRGAWMSLEDSQIMSDLDALFNNVIAKENINGKVGSIGFCMGGAISLLLGCHEPKLAYVIDFYGRIRYGFTSKQKPKDPIDYLVPLKAPLLGLFAGHDELITAEHRDEFSKQLEQLGKSFQLKVYPEASHAFFNDQRPHYDREASADAWQLALSFINKNSKEERLGPN